MADKTTFDLEDLIDLNTRNLEDLCEGELFIDPLVGIDYCKLSFDPARKFSCFYAGTQRDHNGLLVCNYKKFTELNLQ